MFTTKDEIEFNKAFVLKAIQAADAEIEQLKLQVDEVKIGESDWNTGRKRPLCMVNELAWNRQFKVLLSVRMRQYQLQEKELETGNVFPTEWAEVEFEQKEAVKLLRHLDLAKTRTACGEIADCLQGPNQNFWPTSTGGKKTGGKSPGKMFKPVSR